MGAGSTPSRAPPRGSPCTVPPPASRAHCWPRPSPCSWRMTAFRSRRRPRQGMRSLDPRWRPCPGSTAKRVHPGVDLIEIETQEAADLAVRYATLEHQATHVPHGDRQVVGDPFDVGVAARSARWDELLSLSLAIGQCKPPAPPNGDIGAPAGAMCPKPVFPAWLGNGPAPHCFSPQPPQQCGSTVGRAGQRWTPAASPDEHKCRCRALRSAAPSAGLEPAHTAPEAIGLRCRRH